MDFVVETGSNEGWNKQIEDLIVKNVNCAVEHVVLIIQPPKMEFISKKFPDFA